MASELNADHPLVKRVVAYLSKSYRDDPKTPHLTPWAIEIIEIVLSHLSSQAPAEALLTDEEAPDLESFKPGRLIAWANECIKRQHAKSSAIILAKAEKDLANKDKALRLLNVSCDLFLRGLIEAEKDCQERVEQAVGKATNLYAKTIADLHKRLEHAVGAIEQTKVVERKKLDEMGLIKNHTHKKGERKAVSCPRCTFEALRQGMVSSDNFERDKTVNKRAKAPTYPIVPPSYYQAQLDRAYKAGMAEAVSTVESIIPLIKEGLYGELWQAFLEDDGLKGKCGGLWDMSSGDGLLTDEEQAACTPSKSQLDAYLAEPDDAITARLRATIMPDVFREIGMTILYGKNIAKAQTLQCNLIKQKEIEQERERIFTLLDLHENDMGFCEISNHVPWSSLKQEQEEE